MFKKILVLCFVALLAVPVFAADWQDKVESKNYTKSIPYAGCISSNVLAGAVYTIPARANRVDLYIVNLGSNTEIWADYVVDLSSWVVLNGYKIIVTSLTATMAENGYSNKSCVFKLTDYTGALTITGDGATISVDILETWR